MENPITQTKVCNRCRVEKPCTEFTPCKTGKYGVVARCRPCLAAVAKERSDSDPEVIARRAAKPSAEDMAIRKKERARVRAAAWYRENTARALASSKERQSREDVRAKRRARDKELYPQRMQDERYRLSQCAAARRYSQNHPERVREHKRKYRENNRDRVRLYHRKRRLRMRQIVGTHSVDDVRKKMIDQSGKCYWCRKNIIDNDYHVDHIFAVARGGTNGPENICIACPDCNRRKWAKSPLEFIGRLF